MPEGPDGRGGHGGRDQAARGHHRAVTDGASTLACPAPGVEGDDFHSAFADGGGGLVDYLEPKSVADFYRVDLPDLPRRHAGALRHHDRRRLLRRTGLLSRPGRPGLDPAVQRTLPRTVRRRIPSPSIRRCGSTSAPTPPRPATLCSACGPSCYATGFVKTINDWCADHHMGLTGHADQEEVVNPVIGTVGDLIKAFKYQSMPGIDEVFAYGACLARLQGGQLGGLQLRPPPGDDRVLRRHGSAVAQPLQGGHGPVRQGRQHHGAARRVVRPASIIFPPESDLDRARYGPDCPPTTSTSAVSSACSRAAATWPTSACSIR